MHRARPHDLLRLSGETAFPTGAPDWAVHALRRTPWVVVRRGPAPDGLISVGIRGTIRSERYGTHVALGDVHAVKTPEALAHSVPGRELPAMRALRMARPLLDATGLAWGPTGSVGFELATGRATATPNSDLDLLMRAHDLHDALPRMTTLHHQLRVLGARVDCQVETDSGAVVLAELVGRQTVLLIRTPNGPRLLARTALS